MAVVTPTDRPIGPQSFGCVVEVVFVLSRYFLDFSVGVGAFYHRTESDLFLISY